MLHEKWVKYVWKCNINYFYSSSLNAELKPLINLEPTQCPACKVSLGKLESYANPKHLLLCPKYFSVVFSSCISNYLNKLCNLTTRP